LSPALRTLAFGSALGSFALAIVLRDAPVAALALGLAGLFFVGLGRLRSPAPYHGLPRPVFELRREDGDWIELPPERYAEAFEPTDVPARDVPGYGDHRLAIEGVDVAFEVDDHCVRVLFEGEIEPAHARRLALGIRDRVGRILGVPVSLAEEERGL
jgi:hypothetical protein